MREEIKSSGYEHVKFMLLGILLEKLSRQFRYTRLQFTAEVRAVYIFWSRQDTGAEERLAIG